MAEFLLSEISSLIFSSSTTIDSTQTKILTNEAKQQADEELEQLVLTALRAMADDTLETDEDVVRALCNEGLDLMRAEKLSQLVPLAFGRVLIAHIAKVEMSREFDLLIAGETRSKPLESEPFFCVALRLAAAMYHSGPRELFDSAALLSAELQAVNQALNAGCNLDGGVLGNPVIWGTTSADWE